MLKPDAIAKLLEQNDKKWITVAEAMIKSGARPSDALQVILMGKES